MKLSMGTTPRWTSSPSSTRRGGRQVPAHDGARLVVMAVVQLREGGAQWRTRRLYAGKVACAGIEFSVLLSYEGLLCMHVRCERRRQWKGSCNCRAGLCFCAGLFAVFYGVECFILACACSALRWPPRALFASLARQHDILSYTPRASFETLALD